MTTQVEEIDIQIDEANKLRRLRDVCVQFTESANYKEIVKQGYFVNEASRLVMLKGADLDDRQQETIDKMINGISCFHNYLNEILRQGTAMDQAIKADEETREQLLAEELTN
jgi:hypothetical protein